MGTDTYNAEFTELADSVLGGMDLQPRTTHRNVIKRAQAMSKGVEEVGLDEKDNEDPLVFVQRDGDRVTSVDFLCKCGRSASLKIEYDDE